MGNDVSTSGHHKGGQKNQTGENNRSGLVNGANGGVASKKDRQQQQQETGSGVSGANQRMDTVPLEKDEKEEASKSDKVQGKGKGGGKKVHMEQSAGTFGAGSSPGKRRADGRPDQVMITDALSDVRARYHINPREIGHGHYGVVRKCMDRETKEWFAIKSIRKSKVGKMDVLKREISILKEVNHPHIIKLIEVHEDAKYLHLITELCSGGELFDRIIAKTHSEVGHFSEGDAAKIVWSILDAIHYCHEVKQIVHRDLKPENFLFLTEDEHAPIKIIDFGLSRHDDQAFGVMKTKVGTPYYVAPEVLNREYTKSCDIWSIGVITYILLCGYPPFYGDSDNQIFDSVRTGRFDFPSPDWDTVSDAAKDFICCLLQMSPAKRLTAAQALQHRWIKEQNHSEPNQVSHKSTRSITFKKYMGMQKLKKAALSYIATHLTNSEVGALGDCFRQIDKDKNGHLTLQELDDALESGEFPTELQTEVRQLRHDLCLSGEDSLDWRDFLVATMDKSVALREDKIHMAFDHFKKTNATCLRFTDLVDLFGGEAQAKEIMGDVDRDGDGNISYEEFRNMMAGSFMEGS